MEESVLERVRRTVLAGVQGRRVRVFLYGSWVHGSPGRESDIDVGLLPEEDVDPVVWSRLRESLEESDVPYPVELVDLRDADAAFRYKVMDEGLEWTD